MDSRYYLRFAAAFIRGTLAPGPVRLPDSLWNRPLEQLTSEECGQLVIAAKTASINMRSFKRVVRLPRVTAALGILKGLQPTCLLDIGSGRGVSLWPVMEAFPELVVTAIDRSHRNVADFAAASRGGLTTLHALLADCVALPFAEQSFDVTALLEVLEHIPDTASALREAVRVSTRFVLASVPSKPDNNPDHIHCLKEDDLRSLFRAAGATEVKVKFVLNHMLVLAKVGNG